MKSIAYYISDHGFGHASRNIPIIRYILEIDNEILVHIKTGLNQGNFIKESIKDLKNNENVKFYLNKMDIGLVLKENSLDIDKGNLSKEVSDYIVSWNRKIKEENIFLRENNIDLIISDIVPWIFKCSDELSIKSILISNFTWVDIYKEHLDENICNEYIKCYKKANYVFLYNMFLPSMLEYVDKYEEVGLVCRKFDDKKVLEIRRKYNKPKVFVSVGRSVELNSSLDVSNLEYHFIVTEGIKLIGDNVTYLSKETNNTQDYIKGSDYIITKAGWGTVAECLIGNKKFAVLSREGVSEDRYTIQKLIANDLAIRIDSNTLNIEDTLETLRGFKPNYENISSKNNYKYIASKLVSLV